MLGNILLNLKEKLISNRLITEDGHWLWTGVCNKQGYGRLSINGITFLAHRVSFEIFKEDLNYEDLVCHIRECNKKNCFNPNHLYKGNHSTNTQDSLAVGTNHESNVTHCPKGHEYTENNTRTYGNKRHCISCANERYKLVHKGQKSLQDNPNLVLL